MRRLPLSILVCMVLAGCAAKQPPSGSPASLLPGSIGVVVKNSQAGVVVAHLRNGGAAASAGVRPGDVVVRYNGEAVTDARHFNRLVIHSPPGSTALLELRRDGVLQEVEIPVWQLDTTPRG